MTLGVMKRLGLHGTDLSSVGGRSHSDLDWSDVAAALAYGLSPGAQHLGLYLYTADEQSRLIVRRLLSVIISRTYQNDQRGEEMPAETALGLAESVIAELSDRQRCKRCAGSGSVFVKAQTGGNPEKMGVSRTLTTCPKCGGEKVESVSDYVRARLAGLDRRTFKRRYLNAHASGCRAYGAWLTELRDHLNAQLNP